MDDQNRRDEDASRKRLASDGAQHDDRENSSRRREQPTQTHLTQREREERWPIG
jgi:hypothetical protein